MSAYLDKPALSEREAGLLWAARLLLRDVQDYDAWQRPCFAVDCLNEALRAYKDTQ